MNDDEYMRRVRAMEGRLYRVAQAILWREADSLDAVQEAVFRGWIKKDSLRDTERFESWFMRILVNQCRDMLRQRRKEPVELSIEPGREDRMCEDLQLRMALRALPEKYRLLLVLKYLEGYSLKDIAHILRLSPALVTSRLSQARRALRRMLDGGDER